MPQPPRDPAFDSSLALLLEGYEFISNRCNRYDTDLFTTRLLLQDTICMRGAEAAEFFYDRSRFQREGAAPELIKKTLLGTGGVQGLDGAEHEHRKAMFMAMMRPGEIQRLIDLTLKQWYAAAVQWGALDRVVLFEATMELLLRAVCAWSGVPLHQREVEERTNQMAAMIDAGGSIGLRLVRGVVARKQAERWAGDLVRRVRSGELEVPPERPLARIALHRTNEGDLLDEHDAAVELLNIIRPTVAVARYFVFAAHALHLFPAARESVAQGDEDAIERFVQEVRRFYPFFPFAAARTRHQLEWRGYVLPSGVRVLLDLFGTNRHPALWPDPDAFRPDRFANWDESPYDFIPQGGGDHFANHRCAGEWITIALMKSAVRFLTGSVRYQVPEQDLRIRLSRMPAIPESRFLIREVRLMS